MVVYLDLVFLVNSISDALALYVTARLCGCSIPKLRWIIASLIGGIYGILYLSFSYIGGVFLQLIIAAGLVGFVFSRKGRFLQQFFLFFILSCTIGGVLIALVQCVGKNIDIQIFKNMNWKIFLISGFLTYILLSLIFPEGLRHKVTGEIYRGKLVLNRKDISLNVLLDTGHTLSDPYTQTPVLTVWYGSLQEFWTDQEREIIDQLETMGTIWCIEKLSIISPGKFRLLPYRAIGIRVGTMLCFRADELLLDKTTIGVVTVAISPTEISDGEGYTALWGGEIPQKRRKNESKSMDHETV